MKTQTRMASLSLLAILCLGLAAAPARAGILYDNGPITALSIARTSSTARGMPYPAHSFSRQACRISKAFISACGPRWKHGPLLSSGRSEVLRSPQIRASARLPLPGIMWVTTEDVVTSLRPALRSPASTWARVNTGSPYRMLLPVDLSDVTAWWGGMKTAAPVVVVPAEEPTVRQPPTLTTPVTRFPPSLSRSTVLQLRNHTALHCLGPEYSVSGACCAGG